MKRHKTQNCHLCDYT